MTQSLLPSGPSQDALTPNGDREKKRKDIDEIITVIAIMVFLGGFYAGIGLLIGGAFVVSSSLMLTGGIIAIASLALGAAIILNNMENSLPYNGGYPTGRFF